MVCKNDFTVLTKPAQKPYKYQKKMSSQTTKGIGKANVKLLVLTL